MLVGNLNFHWEIKMSEILDIIKFALDIIEGVGLAPVFSPLERIFENY
jgi:hypothetical protein